MLIPLLFIACGDDDESSQVDGEQDAGVVLEDASAPASDAGGSGDDAGTPGGDAGVRSDGGTCQGLGEEDCEASDCHPQYCPGCLGESEFVACAEAPGQILCPGISCPDCVPLGEDACRADTGCHGVYLDQTSDCPCDAPGCCHEFVRCAPSGQAECDAPPLLCFAAPPVCEGPYVISYRDGCFDGCVRVEDCRS